MAAPVQSESKVVKKIQIFLLGCCALSTSVVMASAEDEIAERIKKVGTVCVQGEECPDGTTAVISAAPTTVVASGGGVEANYNKTCATCHNAGVAGAPKMGDAASWEPRLAKGMDVLYSSSINGMPPAMPAKGMCFSCSDDDLKALVDYMVESVQ